MAKFDCIKCGACCSSIRQKIEKEDSDFIRANFFGDSPIVQLVSVEDMSLSLWPWEAEKLRKKAEDLRINADIKPFRLVFDIGKNKSLILSYTINQDSCPFLKEKQCVVYSERPLVCRQFPLQTATLEKMPVFAKCPALKDNDSIKNDKIKDFFGESYDSALKNDLIIEWQNKKIIELIKNNIIRPVKSYPYNFLLKRIENSEKADFTDFLLQENQATKEEINKIIK